ncbi:MAG: hypothetical protein WAV47_13380 [Blastocatellia bacterium]
MQFFQELGSLVEQRWKDRNYDEEAFPEIAAEALSETNPNKWVNPWEIIRWVNTTPQLPAQQDVPAMFGNPPITLYSGPRFYIDVYYWVDGTTSIHQHAFCGAFQVFLGSSILSRYDFEETRKINAHLSAGRITLNEVELLGEGDVRQILPGMQYVHALFHLDRPSATLIIRTRQTPSYFPQYKYQKPRLAVDPFYQEETMIKRLQSAALLLNIKHPQADELIGELLSCSDFQTAFSVLDVAYGPLMNDRLERAFGLSTGKERFESLVEIARRRHGELVDFILPVFEEARREQNLIYRRGQITSNEHRFFLALLLNVPDRAKVLDLVRQRYPENDPVDTIVDWVEELANTRVGGSPEPNVMGIEGIDDDYLFVLHCLLEGRSVEQTKVAFEDEVSAEDARSLGEKLEKLYDEIRRSMLFKSIFLDSTLEMPSRQSLAV